MALHLERRGAGPRLVLAHGFTQTGRSWGAVAQDLAVDHEVLLPDAPGHGGSGAVRATLAEAAALLADQAGRATYLGYSMGARWCLHVALQHPDAVQALVLLGGTAGLADPDERAARVASDAVLAERLDREGLAAFLEAWVAQPLFAGVPPEAVGLEDRLRSTAAGLRSSLELAGTGAQEPLWDRLHELGMPVLVLAGERDARFSELGRRMADSIGPTASFAVVPGAGHAAHLEQPGALLGLVRPWLAERGL
jgi:2-succinyl-6-hydroxy-2,4-cyclohexadiene-1-carboxylate synthase